MASATSSRLLVSVRNTNTDCFVKLNSEMESSSAFRYLGCVVNTDGRLGDEENGRVLQGRKVSGMLTIATRKTAASMDVKKELYE